MQNVNNKKTEVFNMEKKSSRPSQSKELFLNSTISIHLKETDIIQKFTSNDNGNIRTNKRGWDAHNATVIQGEVNTHDNKIKVPAGVRMWSCKVYGGGIISSIGLKNEVVTVIIHI
jgi:hypothetical protein